MSDNCEHGVETELCWDALNYIAQTDPAQTIGINVRVAVRCDDDHGHTVGVWPDKGEAYWLCKYDAAGERVEIEHVS